MPHRTAIPTYKLYGENASWPLPELLHCETIAARSTIYNWEIEPHRHDDLFQILYVRKGRASVSVDQVHQQFHTPVLAVIPPMAVHGFVFEEGTSGYVLTLPNFVLRDALSDAHDLVPHLTAAHVIRIDASTSDKRDLDYLIGRIATEFAGRSSGRTPALDALLRLVFVWIGRHVQSRHARDTHPHDKAAERIRQFHTLVEDHFCQRKPIAFYADGLGVTTAHLNNTCRSQIGKTALEIIHDRLQLEAQRKLIYTSMTINEIAFALGFEDPAYFTRFFTQKFGLAPSRYRADIRSHGKPAKPEVAEGDPSAVSGRRRRGTRHTDEKSNPAEMSGQRLPARRQA